jgi:hypothetical protein
MFFIIIYICNYFFLRISRNSNHIKKFLYLKNNFNQNTIKLVNQNSFYKFIICKIF